MVSSSLSLRADDVRGYASAYRTLLQALLMSPVQEVNARTGRAIKMLPAGPAHFAVDLSEGLLPVVDLRKTFPHVAAAEVAWFVSGSQDVQFMREQGVRIWEDFVEADGQTVEAAYGHRWRRHFGRDQLQCATSALWNNPSDRRVCVFAWDPASDGLGAKDQKNVPCPIGFTMARVGDRLNSSLFIRSSDVFVGLPYDVMGHAMLMAAVASELHAKPGTMSVTLAHPHLYDRHYEMAQVALDQTPVQPEMRLGLDDLEAIEAMPAEYVEGTKSAARALTWPAYCPRPEVVQ